MVDEVTAYKASDGKLFVSKLNAAQHDAGIRLAEILGGAVTAASLTQIIDRAQDVHAALDGLVEALVEQQR